MFTRRPLSASIPVLGPAFAAALALVMTLVMTRPTRANPRIIYVDADASGPTQDGRSWSNAYRRVQSALTHAAPGNEIWVAEGVYLPTSRTDPKDPRSVTFQLVSGVALYGGFAGTEISREQRDWVAHPTLLSGDIGAMGDISDNSYHVVASYSVDSAVLDGFTITGGNSPGSGGGMDNWFSFLVLVNVTLSGNSATVSGGGMYNWFSFLVLVNVTLSGNHAEANGGGIYNYYSSPTLTDLTFSDNHAEDGGGMYNTGYSNPTLMDVTFSDNSAYYGGGMINVDSNPLLTNVAFSGNSAGEGGGMYNDNSIPILTIVTFSGNSATVVGGGMYNYYYSNPTLNNCILWGNTGPQIYNDETSVATVTYSDVQGGYPGSGNIDLDPLFVDALLGDLRLGLSSPAIDAGDNSAVPPDTLDLDGDGDTTEPIPYDLAGRPRFVDIDTVPDTGIGPPPIVDMGAYEAAYNLYLSLVIGH